MSGADIKNCFGFDELLPYLGEFGLYQKRLVAYMIPFVLLIPVKYFTQVFLILVPSDFWCNIPELAHLSKKDRLNLAVPKNNHELYERCHMYDVNYTEVLESNITHANTSWLVKECDSWIYDKTPYESIATEYAWVCRKGEQGNIAIVIFFLGAIVGGLCIGYVIDHWGRIPALMLSNLCALIGGVMAVFCTTFFQFSVASFVRGLGADYSYTPMLLLVLEFVGPQYRTFVTNFSFCIYFTTGGMLLPWLAYYGKDWRLFTVLTTVPIIVSMLMYCVLEESVRWLMVAGKVKEAMIIVENVATVNGKIIPDDIRISFKRCCEMYKKRFTGHQYSALDLFKSWPLVRMTLILILTWMNTALVYNCLFRVIFEVSPSVFIMVSMAAFIELPASILTLFALDATGRNFLSCIVFLGCALTSMLTGMLQKQWSIAFGALITRFFSSITINVGLQWNAELLPTIVRGQAMALIHVMGYMAIIVGLLFVNLEHHLSGVTLIVLSILSVLSALLVLFLPDTTFLQLPQTIADTERMCKAKKIVPRRLVSFQPTSM